MKRTTRTLFAAALGASALSVAVQADVERTCPGAPGVGVIEGWGMIPSGGLVFDLARGIGSAQAPNDTRPAPGLPNNAWVAFQCMIPIQSTPVEQSFANAAATWSNATIPGTTQPASAFSINPNMTRAGTYTNWLAWTLDPFGESLLLSGTPGRNQVTFWEHPSVMALFGTTTLGVALVSLTPGTGTIVDADLAFNAQGFETSTNRALFRFVEDNVALNATITTLALSESPSQTFGRDPVVGYVDIEGVLAHELGHAAGLGHSLIDGPTSQAASATPTMFAIAQVQPYTQGVAFPLAGCTTTSTTQANGLSTQFGGIVGVPARDLTADDVAAVSVAYPGPGQTQLGAISGQVLDAAGNPVRAAHVVAVNLGAPEVHRIGTFSDSAGNYTVGSLLPGQWLVMAEGADIGGYFAGTGLPEFIDPAFNCGGPPVFETELLDANESSNEATPYAGTPVSVAAGAITNVAAFRVEPRAGINMTAASCFDTTPGNTVCGTASDRGTVHNDLAALNARVRLSITGGTPNGLAVLNLGIDRIFAPFGNQFIEVNTLPGGSLTLGLDGLGATFIDVPVNAGLLGTTFYAETADFDPATGVIVIGNTITMRLDAR